MAGDDVGAQVRRLHDRLSYVLVYAPDFPVEDQTSLSGEFQRLFLEVQHLRDHVQDVERKHWLDLLRDELVEARDCFERGETTGGCRLVESAEERLAAWRSKSKLRPTFTVDAEGNARKL